MAKEPKKLTVKQIRAAQRGRSMQANYDYGVMVRDSVMDARYRERQAEIAKRGPMAKKWHAQTLERQSINKFLWGFFLLYPLGFLFSPFLIWAAIVNIKGIVYGVQYSKTGVPIAEVGLVLNCLLLVGGIIGAIISIHFWLELWSLI